MYVGLYIGKDRDIINGTAHTCSELVRVGVVEGVETGDEPVCVCVCGGGGGGGRKSPPPPRWLPRCAKRRIADPPVGPRLLLVFFSPGSCGEPLHCGV